MAAKKQKGGKSSSSGRSRPAEVPAPRTPANPTRGRQEHDGVDENLDERALARRHQKPRSARATMKGPNNRKGSTSGKKG